MRHDKSAIDIPAATVAGPTRHRRRYWQFSLRGLLALVTLMSVGLAWLTMKAAHAHRQRAAVVALGTTGFFYDFQRSPGMSNSLAWPGFDENAQPPGPAIIRWLWGEYVLANIVALVSSEPKTQLAPGAIRQLAALDTLEELDLSGQPIADRDLDALRGLVRIKSLILADTQITDAGLERLSGMTSLEQLGVNGTLISGVGLIHLSRCKNLRDLDISNAPITRDGAREIEHLSMLRSLWARFDTLSATDSSPNKPTSGVGDTILKSCARLQRLEELNVEGRDITENGLAHISTLASLEVLDISSTNVTDNNLSVLRSLRQLVTLKLCHTSITDEGIRELFGLKNLWKLELQGTRISDEIVNCVSSFPSLQQCGTDDTGVTPEGRERIDDELLNLAVKCLPP